MRSHLFIHILAFTLTFAVIGELSIAWHLNDVIVMEVDSDGEEEEENKEDKLKEYYLDSHHHYEMVDSYYRNSSIYFILSWNTPSIEHMTPPPELG